MNMIDQPRVLAARQGAVWVREGFRLFHRAPLIWVLTLLAYWLALMVMSLLPLLGLMVPIVLSPGLGLGFMMIAQAIDRGETAAPVQLLAGFRAPGGRHLLRLGLIYLLALSTILLLSVLLDDDWFQPIVEQTTSEAESSGRASVGVPTGLVVVALGYLPIMMAFWYAPQLMIWRQFPAGKALFYSFFAVWRNRAAFLVYGLGWLGVILGASLLVSAAIAALGGGPQRVLLGVMPVSLLLMAIGHGSFYASTRDVFEVRHPTDIRA